MFQKATKAQSKLRLSLVGPSGSGKTMSSLLIASALGSKIAVIDTERGSASKYSDKVSFDVCQLEDFHPENYIKTIKEAEAAGYDVLVIDSLSHAWSGPGGALELVDRAAKGSKSGNSFGAWRDVTPIQNRLVDAILRSRCHVIATMRTKTEYVLEKNDRGNMVPRKVGMAPIQRSEIEYEFDVVGELDAGNMLDISKTRCEALFGKQFHRPGADLGKLLAHWLSEGAPARPAPVEVKAAPATKPPPAAEPRPPHPMVAVIVATKTMEDLEALIPKIQALEEKEREEVRPHYGSQKQALLAAARGKALADGAQA